MDWFHGKYPKGCYSFLDPKLGSFEETLENLRGILRRQDGLEQVHKQFMALRDALRKEREEKK